MPGLRLFRRRWGLASDDLPFVAGPMAVVHLIWTFLCVALLVAIKRRRHWCSDSQELEIAIGGMLGASASAMALEVATAIVASRGAMFRELSRRRAAVPLVYATMVMYVLTLGFNSYATHLGYSSRPPCLARGGEGPGPAWDPHKELLVLVWIAWASAILAFLIAAITFKAFPDNKSERGWQTKFAILSFCAWACRRRAPDGWEEIAVSGTSGGRPRAAARIGRLFSGAFSHIDMTSTDVVAGWFVATTLQKIGRRELEAREAADRARQAACRPGPGTAPRLEPSKQPTVSALDRTVSTSSTEPQRGDGGDEGGSVGGGGAGDGGGGEGRGGSANGVTREGWLRATASPDAPPPREPPPSRQTNARPAPLPGPSPGALPRHLPSVERVEADTVLDAAHYIRYCYATYGFLMYVLARPVTGPAEVLLASCARLVGGAFWSFRRAFFSGARHLGCGRWLAEPSEPNLAGSVGPPPTTRPIPRGGEEANPATSSPPEGDGPPDGAIAAAAADDPGGGSTGLLSAEGSGRAGASRPPSLSSASQSASSSSRSTETARSAGGSAALDGRSAAARRPSLLPRLRVAAAVNRAAILSVIRLRQPSDLVFVRGEGEVADALPYLIAIDRGRRRVVLAIRGTMSLEDAVSDFLFEPVGMDEWADEGDGRAADVSAAPPALAPASPADKFLAHGGIALAARATLADVLATGVLAELTLSPTGRCRGWPLVVTGHSLGAGCAFLVALRLRAAHPDLVCWAFSPPGGLASAELCRRAEPWCTSVLTGMECVPRLSSESVARLRDEVIGAALRCHPGKIELLRGALARRAWTRAELIGSDPSDVSSEAQDAADAFEASVRRPNAYGTLMERSAGFTTPGRCLYFEQIGGIKFRKSASRGVGERVARGVRDAAPGGARAAGSDESGARRDPEPSAGSLPSLTGRAASIAHLAASELVKKAQDKARSRHAEKRRRYRPRWVDPQALQEGGILLSGRMLLDHMPDHQVAVMARCARAAAKAGRGRGAEVATDDDRNLRPSFGDAIRLAARDICAGWIGDEGDGADGGQAAWQAEDVELEAGPEDPRLEFAGGSRGPESRLDHSSAGRDDPDSSAGRDDLLSSSHRRDDLEPSATGRDDLAPTDRNLAYHDLDPDDVPAADAAGGGPGRRSRTEDARARPPNPADVLRFRDRVVHPAEGSLLPLTDRDQPPRMFPPP